MTKQEEGKLRSKFTRWPPSWIIWAFQVSRLPQILRVSLTIVYTWQDHGLESLKMAFFVVTLDSKYSQITPKFVKQKSHWLHSSIKVANPDWQWHLTLNDTWLHSYRLMYVLSLFTNKMYMFCKLAKQLPVLDR